MAEEVSDLTRYTPDKYRLLKLDNREGSVEHYYHYIFGYLAPILLREPKKLPPFNYLVRSCGPMDKITAEFNFTDITVIPKQDWIGIVALHTVPGRKLVGMDHPSCYDPAVLQRYREIVHARLNVPVPERADLTVIINRGESPAFYQSDAAENKRSANIRRSVPNMDEVVAAVREVRPDVQVVELETASLAEQVALFSRAKTVIAQHGAALTNVLWMPPGGHVVEFVPTEITRGKFERHFADLALATGQTYAVVPQAHCHAKIDAGKVVAALGG